MNTQALQLALAQLAMLVFSTMVVISQPKFVYIIAFILGLSLSYSVGTAVALVDKFQKSTLAENKQQYAATLGTHLGGALCYIVMLEHLLDNIH